jgi:hypothetical protein
MMALGKSGRKEMGLRGRQHVLQNYNFNNFGKTWLYFMLDIHNEEGSWESRKNYSGIRFKEVA